MIYSGIYKNGKDGIPYSCEVDCTPSAFTIHFTNEAGQAQHVSWEHSLIHPFIQTRKETYHTLTYGTFPYESLQINKPNLIAELAQLYPESKLQANRQYAIFSWNKPLLLGIAAAFFGIIALLYFLILPWLTGFLASRIPVETEISIGEGMYKQEITKYQTIPEASKQATLFLQQLANDTTYPLQVDVVKSNQLNAFALPGGHIIVYDSILKTMDSYEELAALLGHEYSHIKLHHSTRNIMRNISLYVIVSLITGDGGDLVSIVLNHSQQLESLSYSRGLEEEADLGGLDLMLKKGINPQGMINMLQTLETASQSAGAMPEFLSTHPDPGARIRAIEKRLTLQKGAYRTLDTMQEQFKAIQLALGK